MTGLPIPQPWFEPSHSHTIRYTRVAIEEESATTATKDIKSYLGCSLR